MPPAQTNADLLRVTRGGHREEPGASLDAGAGNVVFNGSARVYYREIQERTSTAQGRDVIVRRILIVDSRGPAIEWTADDVVEFRVDGAAAASVGRVQYVEGSRLKGFAGTGVETTRLELDPA